MKYHEYPDILTYNNYTVNWDDLPDTLINGNTTYSVKALIKIAADTVKMKYGIVKLFKTFSWATPRAVKNGLIDMGYNVNRTNHSPSDLKLDLITNANPVIMVGSEKDLWPLPSPLDLLGEGHYWICDGIKTYTNTVEFYVEFWDGYSSYNTYGYYTPSNPGQHTSEYAQFHMNWGQANTSHNTWYANPDGPRNYIWARQNFYISKQ
jgi:hypothetical protein